MANSTKNIFFLVYAICFLSMLCVAYGNSSFTVEGKVYCDTCRVEFVTKAIKYIQGASIRLECKEREGGVITYKQTGVTDATGTYRILVDEDHEEEICEVFPVNSPDPECNEASKKAARTSLTHHNGMASTTHFANPICFLKKEPLPECAEILKQLGITPTGLLP